MTPIQSFNWLINQAKKDYEERYARYEADLKKEQLNCIHKEANYFPDASGNNDSWYECKNCGKYARRMWEFEK